jgi:hypothetical protein
VLWDRTLAEASVRRLASMDQQGDTVLAHHDPGMWAECIDVQVLHREANRR